MPTSGQIAEGPYIIIEPVYTVALNPQEIASALDKVIKTGHPLVPTPTREETAERAKGSSPLLRAAGVRTWTELARGGQSYAILWESDRVKLLPSKRDKHGRFVDDPERAKIFPKDISALALAEAILEDVRSRSELDAGAPDGGNPPG